MSKLSQYKAEIRKMFDWLALVEDCKANKEPDDNGGMTGTAYLGSVLSLTPSGKYYLPFAHSNVEGCPQCGGTGSTKKQYMCDSCWGTGTRKVSEIAVLTGENWQECHDRITSNPMTTFVVNPMTKEIDDEYFECWTCHGTGKVSHSCSRCGGLGSYEAYLDQEWNSALESVAESFGLFVTGSDSDGCDILVGMSFDSDETENDEND